jgi:hypothetical protein
MNTPCTSPDHFVISNGIECIGCSAHNQGLIKNDDQPTPSSPFGSIGQDDLPHPESESSLSPPFKPSSPPNHTLYGADINLSHLSKQEGAFILSTSRSTLLNVSFILDTFAQNATTHTTFTAAYKSTNPQQSWIPRAVVTSFVAIFENLANTLSPSFSDRDGMPLRERFPHMWTWMSDCAMLGQAASSTKREWRNSCAHRAFIEAPFEHQCSSVLRARAFKAGAFFDVLMAWMPPLQQELEDLVAVLERDGDSLVEKDYAVDDFANAEYSVEAQQRSEERAQMLIEEGREGSEELKALQDAEDASREAVNRMEAVFAIVARKFEEKAVQRKDEKIRRAEEIWKEAELAGAAQAAEWDSVNEGDSEAQGVWDERGWGDANDVVGYKLSSNPDSGNEYIEAETPISSTSSSMSFNNYKTFFR